MVRPGREVLTATPSSEVGAPAKDTTPTAALLASPYLQEEKCIIHGLDEGPLKVYEVSKQWQGHA